MTYEALFDLSISRTARVLGLRLDGEAEASRKVRVLPLFEESARQAAVAKSPPGSWVCMVLGAHRDGWQTVALRPDQLVPLEATKLERDTWDEDWHLVPVDLTRPMRPGPQQERESLEAVAVLARLDVECSWSYRKDGATTAETRRGVLTGIKGHLMFALDADRAGALRGFKREQVFALFPQRVDCIPTWTPGVGYTIARSANLAAK